MSEWSSYRVSDFILFSHDILLSVYVSYNEAIWPIQMLFTALSLTVLLLLWKGGPSRVISLILAGAWSFTGAVFHLRYFQSINWAAVYFSWIFLFESTLLIYFGVLKGSLKFSWPRSLTERLGLVGFILALAVPVHGMGFGWGPDHTAVGTLGLLLLGSGTRTRALMFIPPLLWLMVTGLIQYGLH